MEIRVQENAYVLDTQNSGRAKAVVLQCKSGRIAMQNDRNYNAKR